MWRWCSAGILVVQSAGLVLINGLLERVWGIPSTGLIRFVLRLVLGVTAAAFILKYGDDFNITALLTTSALITVIIGLAAQSTLAGVFSGIALQLERQIQPGDIIRVDNRLTRVDAISWRSITVRRTMEYWSSCQIRPLPPIRFHCTGIIKCCDRRR